MRNRREAFREPDGVGLVVLNSISSNKIETSHLKLERSEKYDSVKRGFQDKWTIMKFLDWF